MADGPSKVPFNEKRKLFQVFQQPNDAQNTSIPTDAGGSSTPHTEVEAGNRDDEQNPPKISRRMSVKDRMKAFQSTPSSTGAANSPSTVTSESSFPHTAKSVRYGKYVVGKDKEENAAIEGKESKFNTLPRTSKSGSTCQSRSTSSSAGPSSSPSYLSPSAGPTGQSRLSTGQSILSVGPTSQSSSSTSPTGQPSSSTTPTGQASSTSSKIEQLTLTKSAKVSSAQSGLTTQDSDSSQNNKLSDNQSKFVRAKSASLSPAISNKVDVNKETLNSTIPTPTKNKQDLHPILASNQAEANFVREAPPLNQYTVASVETNNQEKVKLLTEHLKVKDKEAEHMKQQLELLESPVEFENLKTQYSQLEQEHKQVLTNLASMGQLSSENIDLRNELSKSDAYLQKVQSALDASLAEASVYKSDFEEERKDRAAAHSKLDDLKNQMAEQESKFQDELKAISNELNKTLQEFEDVEEELETKLKNARDIAEQCRAEAHQGREELLAKTSQVEAFRKQVDQLQADLEEQNLQLKEKEDALSNLEEKNSRLQVVLSRMETVQRTLDFKQKQTQHQLPPNQKAAPHYDERSLSQHAVKVRRAMKFDQPIGEGSYGAVYAVKHDGKPCIAKRLHDILVGRNPTHPISVEEKDGIHCKFVQECVLLSQMQHPNIVRFIGVIINDRDKYNLTLLMERLSTDLHVYLLKNANIPLSLKVSTLHDVSCGLLYLHESSIIHRDLSAANILLTADMQAKIADLGMSRFVDGDILTNAPGAQAYMSPEALQNKKYDESLDLFSFGVIALFATIQEFPAFSHVHVPDAIHAKGEGEIHKRRLWIDKMNTQQPELSSLVLWCLQDDPMKRPSTFALNTLLNEMRKDY